MIPTAFCIGAKVELGREWTMAAYAAASIHLYSRLWRELEELSDHLGATTGQDDSRTGQHDMELVTFRLEVALLLDACDGTRWQSLLLPEQRLILRKTLTQLLDTLSVPSDALGLVNLYSAQNQLYDAVRGQCAAIIHHPNALSDHWDALPDHPNALLDHTDTPSDHSGTLPAAAAFWSNRSRSPSAACRRRIGSPINS